jgi:hypothetical protein
VTHAEVERDAAVRLTILETFVAGDRPSVASVAAALALDEADAAASFDRLAAGRAIVLGGGSRDLLMAAPFAGTPTDHRVHVGERAYYANCVWDALGIPAMLAAAGRPAEARITTRCPDCAATIHLAVQGGQVVAEPDEPVAHFAVPAARWWEDIGFT